MGGGSSSEHVPDPAGRDGQGVTAGVGLSGPATEAGGEGSSGSDPLRIQQNWPQAQLGPNPTGTGRLGCTRLRDHWS